MTVIARVTRVNVAVTAHVMRGRVNEWVLWRRVGVTMVGWMDGWFLTRVGYDGFSSP